MNSGYFIAGEWGSTFMRLYLCDQSDGHFKILTEAHGTGVMSTKDFEDAFFTTAQPWFDAHGHIPVILSGMVGGNIGWHDTGYATCPASSSDIRPFMFKARGVSIAIAPGLSCHNMFGLADVVRGEDMQMLGWLDSQVRAADERHILCLPGRHVKWVITEGTKVASFFTGMNGEMEDILLQHSLLGRGVERTDTLSQPDFDAGIAIMFADPTLSLGHALFATRSRLVLGELTPKTAASFLSGLLIGADIRDALKACQDRGLSGPVIVMGASELAKTYAAIMIAQGRETIHVTTPHLAIQGMFNLFDQCETA